MTVNLVRILPQLWQQTHLEYFLSCCIRPIWKTSSTVAADLPGILPQLWQQTYLEFFPSCDSRPTWNTSSAVTADLPGILSQLWQQAYLEYFLCCDSRPTIGILYFLCCDSRPTLSSWNSWRWNCLLWISTRSPITRGSCEKNQRKWYHVWKYGLITIKQSLLSELLFWKQKGRFWVGS